MNIKENKTTAIRDPIWKHIWIYDSFLDILNSNSFMRLYRIKQLGPTEYLYPGATHTRASHSLGVYYLSNKLLNILCLKGADKWLNDSGKKSFLIASLLHDLGHFPFTHALKELPLFDHEKLSALLILEEPLKTIIGRTGADPYMVASIIDETSTGKEDLETNFYRKVLSGVLDPDKIDYLNRDAYFCGVPYGIQDTDFVLSQIYPDKELGLCISSKGIIAIENVLFSKYLMYKSVYWHKQVRIITAMMKKALYSALKSNTIKSEQLYNIDDEGLYYLLATKEFEEKSLVSNIREKKFFSVLAEFKLSECKDNFIKSLENLEKRNNIEIQLSNKLSEILNKKIEKFEIIIDIPENISFENDLTILSDSNNINSTVFTDSVVKDFTNSLRIVRILISSNKFVFFENIKDIRDKIFNYLSIG